MHEDDIGEEAIEDFEASRAGSIMYGPYTPAVPKTICDEQAAELIDEWWDDIGRQAAALFAHVSTAEFAARPFFKLKPCPPWLYVALHRRARTVAATFEGDLDMHVSGITGIAGGRGGKMIKDSFEVLSTDMVEALVKPFNVKGLGLALFKPKERTGLAMVPPLEFMFSSKRQGDAPRKYPTELVVTLAP